MQKMPFPINDLGHLPHILIVDDDERIRDLTSRYLEDHGFVAICASSAPHARTLLEEFTVDVMVVDVMMPGETGLEFTKSLQGKRNVPVLLLTALSEANNRIEGLESGADDYLTKPFEPRELVLRLNSILRRSMNSSKAISGYGIGPYIFDVSSDTFMGSGASKPLTETETRLLKAMASRKGEVVSREELADICDIDGGGRSIDVQVTRLRRKIEENPKSPKHLQTVRGKGYRLFVEETS